MKRRFRWDKKYLYWGMTAFCVIACAIVFYMALNYISLLWSGLGKLVSILGPFIWGIAISYILSPLMKLMERKIFLPLGAKLFKNSKKHSGQRFGRGMSVLCSIIIFLAVVTALIYMILPQLYVSIQTIVANTPQYIANLTIWLEMLLEDFPEIEEYALSVLGSMSTSLSTWIQGVLLPELGNLLSSVTSGVSTLITAVYNILLGIIVSIYMLGNLEGFGSSVRRLLYAIFSVENAQKIRDAFSFVDRTVIGFLNGKLLDSAIIGLICYVVCALLKMPFALLVSVIVGITNIIPFFGPLIGAVPSALIILMVDPVKCLIFIVFILLLQQLDGNFIGPKILGNSVGINGFWVMFSIVVGAGLFGFWGMLFGVPAFVVISTAVNTLTEKKLKENDLPWETEKYRDLDHIDPITREPVKKLRPDDEAEDTEESAQE